MKRLWFLPAFITLTAAVLAPVESSAGRLHYATPDTPVAFTWPAVRIWEPRSHLKHVRKYRHVKRPRAARSAYRTKRIARGCGCQPPRMPYRYPPTGYTPLPYEFGPWCATIVSRY
jgi:hypothetical protein